MTTYSCSFAHQMAIAIVLLSIVSHLSPGHAQQSLTIDEQQQPAMQMLFNEFLGSVPADGKTNYYGQQLKYQQLKHQLRQQHLRPKQLPIVYFTNHQWPFLRDLVMNSDYDLLGHLESSERERDPQESQLLTRLHRLADNALDGDDQLFKLSSGAKQHNNKRNAQYEAMSFQDLQYGTLAQHRLYITHPNRFTETSQS
uniref:Uncharacterized protein n=1 Tax=Drosophila mojavensis TaxID=7230 RepID=A0A0B4UE99_DROMO|nr:hypothetical protein [Drosophila mojavensis]AJC97597.1 hypothetical protein [Drosophila mojavensis]